MQDIVRVKEIQYDPCQPYPSMYNHISNVLAFTVLPSHRILLARQLHPLSKMIYVQEHLPANNRMTIDSILQVYQFGQLSVHDYLLLFFTREEVLEYDLLSLVRRFPGFRVNALKTPTVLLQFSPSAQFVVIYTAPQLQFFPLFSNATTRSFMMNDFAWSNLAFSPQGTSFVYRGIRELIYCNLLENDQPFNLCANDLLSTKTRWKFVDLKFIDQDYVLSKREVHGPTGTYIETQIRRVGNFPVIVFHSRDYYKLDDFLWAYMDNLVVSVYDNELVFYSIDLSHNLHRHRPISLPAVGKAWAFSSNLRYLVLGDESNCYVYDTKSCSIRFYCPYPCNKDVAFGIKKEQVIFRSTKYLIFGDLQTREYKIARFPAHKLTLQFAIDDRNVIICSDQKFQMIPSNLCAKKFRFTDPLNPPPRWIHSVRSKTLSFEQFQEKLCTYNHLNDKTYRFLLQHFIENFDAEKLEFILLRILQCRDFESHSIIRPFITKIMKKSSSLGVFVLTNMFQAIGNCSGQVCLRTDLVKPLYSGQGFALDHKLWVYGKNEVREGNTPARSYILSIPGFLRLNGPYREIVESGNREMMQTNSMKYAIQYKWDQYGYFVQNVRLSAYSTIGLCYFIDQVGLMEYRFIPSIPFLYCALILAIFFWLEESCQHVVAYYMKVHSLYRIREFSSKRLDPFLALKWRTISYIRLLFGVAYYLELVLKIVETPAQVLFPTPIFQVVVFVDIVLFSCVLPVFFLIALICYKLYCILRFTYELPKWDLLDMITYSCLIATCIYRIADKFESSTLTLRVLSAWTSVFYALNFLNFLRPYRTTGPLIRMLTQILHDLRSFMLVQFVLLVGFIFAFMILLVDEKTSPFQGWLSLLTGYEMILGHFEREWFSNRSNEQATYHGFWLFVLYMFLVMIVSMNLLIAIMGDSFNKIRDHQELEGRIEQARVLNTTDWNYGFLFEYMNAHKYFPKYLHVLIPEDQVVDRGSGWERRLMHTEITLNSRLEENSKLMSARFNKLDMEQENLNSKLDRLISLLEPRTA